MRHCLPEYFIRLMREYFTCSFDVDLFIAFSRHNCYLVVYNVFSTECCVYRESNSRIELQIGDLYVYKINEQDVNVNLLDINIFTGELYSLESIQTLNTLVRHNPFLRISLDRALYTNWCFVKYHNIFNLLRYNTYGSAFITNTFDYISVDVGSLKNINLTRAPSPIEFKIGHKSLAFFKFAVYNRDVTRYPDCYFDSTGALLPLLNFRYVTPLVPENIDIFFYPNSTENLCDTLSASAGYYINRFEAVTYLNSVPFKLDKYILNEMLNKFHSERFTLSSRELEDAVLLLEGTLSYLLNIHETLLLFPRASRREDSLCLSTRTNSSYFIDADFNLLLRYLP